VKDKVLFGVRSVAQGITRPLSLSCVFNCWLMIEI